uniref:Uncharacterized protein n=1 Tax=Timema genevievae TaxID=629358 RepID=A0A7R9K2T2_TIMGE|nr:unnamed protein product [Timema genevievae]
MLLQQPSLCISFSSATVAKKLVWLLCSIPKTIVSKQSNRHRKNSARLVAFESMETNTSRRLHSTCLFYLALITCLTASQRFYLVGSNNTQTRFRVLKIDRTEPRELSVVDDGTEYSHDEIRDLVTMIDVGNRTRVGQRLSSNGVARVVSAFGIVGKFKL